MALSPRDKNTFTLPLYEIITRGQKAVNRAWLSLDYLPFPAGEELKEEASPQEEGKAWWKGGLYQTPQQDLEV